MNGLQRIHKGFSEKRFIAAVMLFFFLMPVSHLTANEKTGVRFPSVDISGPWRIDQSPGYVGTLFIKQSQNQISGDLSWDRGHRPGDIKGSIKENTIKFTVDYGDGLIGTYEAHLSEGQMCNGTALSNKGGPAVTWRARRPQGV